MKKIFVLAFVFVVAAGAFAQTPALTFGMYGDLTPTIDSPKTVFGVYTETYLSFKAKDMGLAATVVAGTDFFAAPRNYSFWYQWCNGIKISAGKLREAGSARLTSYIDGNGFSTRMANVENGVMAYWDAVKNITVAGFVPVSGVAPLTDLKNSSVGVSFAIPNIATIVSAYRLNGYEFSVGADLKVIKDVTLKAGFKNSGTFGSASTLYATGAKTVGDLKVAFDANFVAKPASAYGIKGMVEYTMGKYVLGTKASVDNGDPWYGNNGLNLAVYVMRNFDAGDIKVSVTYDAATTDLQLPVDFEISF